MLLRRNHSSQEIMCSHSWPQSQAVMQAMHAKGLDENAPCTIGHAAQAYAAATLAGMSCCSSDWDALDSVAARSCTPEPGTPKAPTVRQNFAADLESILYRDCTEDGNPM